MKRRPRDNSTPRLLIGSGRTETMLETANRISGRTRLRPYLEVHLLGRVLYLRSQASVGLDVLGVVSGVVIPTEGSIADDCLVQLRRPDWLPIEDWIGGQATYYGPVSLRQVRESLPRGNAYLYPNVVDIENEAGRTETLLRGLQREDRGRTLAYALLILFTFLSMTVSRRCLVAVSLMTTYLLKIPLCRFLLNQYLDILHLEIHTD